MNDGIKEQKKILRKKTICWRESIAVAKRIEWDQLICRNICQMQNFTNAKCIAGYISIKGEVNPNLILENALKIGVKVVLPATEPLNHMMLFRGISDLNTLVPGGYGILEPPKANEIIKISAIDIIIVPGVAFSRNGARLGYGGGYYDAALMQTKSLKIAVAYSGQVYDDIPTDANDIMMDYLITECEILKFS
jgi:5-formyltetrahydrofolate cyclo-ligase